MHTKRKNLFVTQNHQQNKKTKYKQKPSIINTNNNQTVLQFYHDKQKFLIELNIET